MKKLKWDKKLCTGCRVCESICAFSHEGVINPILSRIRIAPLGKYEETQKSTICQQCKDAECVKACPTDALKIDIKKGYVTFTEDDCIGCSACVEACPFSAIFMHPEKNTALKCDLCGGFPKCVEHCLSGALKVIEY
ncbi:MAG: 4Fe-4S dicluster domain-containing protein [Eubacteriaceae bacterium]